MTRIIFLLMVNICLSQELRVPFYEPFEKFNSTKNWQIQEIESNRINPKNIYPNYSNSLNISINSKDYVLPEVSNDGRTRAEVALLNHSIENDQVFYYSWDLFVPKDQKFERESKDSYYVIMQWHEDGIGEPTYCLAGKNLRLRRAFPISLRLLPESLNSESQMNLHLKYGTTYGPGNAMDNGDICPEDPYSRGYREYVIEKAIKLGEWQQIVTQIKWSKDGNSAFIRMWINGLPIINETEIYNRKTSNPPLYLGNKGAEASFLDGVPLLYTKIEEGKEVVEQNYMKLGHYRKHYNSDNEIYVDNFRITTAFPPPPLTTKLIDQYCDREIQAQADYILESYEISPADKYLFRFEDGLTKTSNEVISYNQYLNLMEENWIHAGKTYDVLVRALNDLNNGSGFDFGKSCKITTPAETRLFDIFSGKNLSSPYIVKKNENISAYPLPGATDYLFKVIDLQDTKKIMWIPGNGKVVNSINLSKISGIKENSTYQISVKASRIDNGKDEYAHLKNGEDDFIKVNKTKKNLDKKVKISLNNFEESVQIQSSTKLKNIYLISQTGEILLKSLVDLKETRLDLSPFKNQLYQIVVIDNRSNIFSVLLNTDVL